MEKYYSFAGVELAVCAPEQWIHTEEFSLAPFRVDRVQNPHWFRFTMVDSLTPPVGELLAKMGDLLIYQQDQAEVRYLGASHEDWKNAHMRCFHRGKIHEIELRADAYQSGMSVKTVLNAAQTEHLIVENSGFFFHASFVQIGNRAILFTAPSETGKSTQAELWKLHRGARVCNGDRCAVRCTPEGVFACGVPFMGSSDYCENVALPLAAVVYLAQAPVTTIRRLKGAEAFRRIWEGVSVNVWNRDDVSRMMDLVGQMLEHVPVYYMPCTPDERAVIALEQALKE